MTVTVRNISKSFGEVNALAGISFEAKSGSPFGLLGRNGAGKTTCMRIIMNVFEPDMGEVLLDGRPLKTSGARLGYLPEERGLYRKMRVGEQLEYFAMLRGLGSRQAKEAVSEWLERLDMTDVYKSKVETLSKGNQQRIQLALSMINDPDVIILDEPFSGLDPVNAAQLKDIVSEMAQKGKLIILSSHQMNVVEDFCEDIMILRRGKCVLSGSLEDIRASWPHRDIRIAAGDNDEAMRIASAYGEVERVRGGLMLKLNGTYADVNNGHGNNGTNAASSRLLRELAGSGAGVYTFETVEPSLEQIFVSCAADDADAECGDADALSDGQEGEDGR